LNLNIFTRYLLCQNKIDKEKKNQLRDFMRNEKKKLGPVRLLKRVIISIKKNLINLNLNQLGTSLSWCIVFDVSSFMG